MVARFRADRTKGRIVAISHGAAGYMTLDDAIYDRVRNRQHGNPYKDQIAGLTRDGVEIEKYAAQRIAGKHWLNAELSRGLKVSASADLRIIELVWQGFVRVQP